MITCGKVESAAYAASRKKARSETRTKTIEMRKPEGTRERSERALIECNGVEGRGRHCSKTLHWTHSAGQTPRQRSIALVITTLINKWASGREGRAANQLPEADGGRGIGQPTSESSLPRTSSAFAPPFAPTTCVSLSQWVLIASFVFIFVLDHSQRVQTVSTIRICRPRRLH